MTTAVQRMAITGAATHAHSTRPSARKTSQLAGTKTSR